MNKLHFWRQAVTVVLALLLSAPAWSQGGGKSLRIAVRADSSYQTLADVLRDARA